MSSITFECASELFDIAESLTERSGTHMHFGLDEVGPKSSLAQDDVDMDGYTVSGIVTSAMTAALDHVITLHSVARGGITTNSGPWTLMRGVIESSSVAVWILAEQKRAHRRERALRVWHHDMKERGNWERNTGHVPLPPGQPASARMTQIVGIAKKLHLRPEQVTQKLLYSRTVHDAGVAVGMPGQEAQARWSECSGFAHGRSWSAFKLSRPVAAKRMRDGTSAMVALSLSETDLKPVVNLATTLVNTALSYWADAANG